MEPLLNIEQDGFWEALAKTSFQDKVFVSPTDTVFGFGCSIHYAAGPERILALKGGPPRPLITLIPSLASIENQISITPKHRAILEAHWPGAITFIIPQGENNRSLRCPDSPFLQKLLAHTGPLFSTSCNLHGQETVKSAVEAKDLFGDLVDLYIEGPTGKAAPSTIVNLVPPEPQVLRPGPVPFDPSQWVR